MKDVDKPFHFDFYGTRYIFDDLWHAMEFHTSMLARIIMAGQELVHRGGPDDIESIHEIHRVTSSNQLMREILEAKAAGILADADDTVWHSVTKTARRVSNAEPPTIGGRDDS